MTYFFVIDDTNEQELFVFHRFVRVTAVTVYDVCLKINIESANPRSCAPSCPPGFKVKLTKNVTGLKTL